ncbi:metalloregulator ArsR/SmtB family transcription factor [bacterium]|nr:metalloregulator ArsR/SmtB family transcription factor [bacterium]
MVKQTNENTKSLLSKTAGSLKAMAHPVRLSIIDLLKDGKRLNVTQIYQTLGVEQAVASQHLSILREKNVLDSERQGKHSIYFLKYAGISDVVEIINSTHLP